MLGLAVILARAESRRDITSGRIYDPTTYNRLLVGPVHTAPLPVQWDIVISHILATWIQSLSVGSKRPQEMSSNTNVTSQSKRSRIARYWMIHYFFLL